MIDLAELGEAWLMDAVALQDLYARLTGPAPVATVARVDRGPRVGPVVAGSVAEITMRGPMMKRVPDYFAWYGIDAVATGDVARALEQAAADPEVRTIVLRIDSPGGQVSGVPELADLVRAVAQRKPVHAVVEDCAASAAYWVASQATSVSAPPSGRVGSIGVYQVLVDLSKRVEEAGIKVHVVASGALKGMGEPGTPITDEHVAYVKGLVDATANDFVGAVARGRSRHLDTDKAKALATGRVWRSAEAVALGLIDRSEPVGAALGRINTTTRERFMADQQEIETAGKTAREEERARVRAINAAFPDDPKFCAEQIDKGATLEQASVAYIPVIRAKQAAAEKALADEKAKKPEPAPAPKGGTAPVPHGEPAEASGDFMAQARARAKANGTKLTVAMQSLAKENPDLHRAFVQAQQPVKLADVTAEIAGRVQR